MFDDLYPEASEAALTAKAARPPEPQPTQRFSVWGMLSAAPKGVAAGAAQGAASGADLTKAVRDKVPANVSGPLGHIPFVNAITSAMQVGADILNPTEGQFTSEVGTSLRNVAKDYTPDAQTTHVAESAVFNLFRVGSKALTAAAAGGNIPGAVIAGAEEGFSTADDLARQGVDIKTRTKVGAVTAATNAVGFALPAAGKTWAQTGALALAGGPVSFMAQNQATREILQNADYSKLADQYDPLDLLGLPLSTVLTLGFGALAMRGARGRNSGAQGVAQGVAPLADSPPAIHPPADLVDAARVTLLRENMDATNPVRGDITQADAHVTAYTRAMDQQANGERVQVDVPEAVAVKATQEMAARVETMRAEVAAMADEIPPQILQRNQPQAPADTAPAATKTVAEIPKVSDFMAERGMVLPDVVDSSAPKGNAFISWLKGAGGVAWSQKVDIVGERGVRGNYAGIFTKNGQNLDTLVESAVQAGYLTRADLEASGDVGGTRALSELIRRATTGEKIATVENADAARIAQGQARAAMDAVDAMERELKALGVDTSAARGNADALGAYLAEHRTELVNKNLADIDAETRAERIETGEAYNLNPKQIDAQARIALAGELDENAMHQAAMVARDEVDFLNRIEEIINNAPGSRKTIEGGPGSAADASVPARDGQAATDPAAKPADTGQPVSAGEASLDARLADISYRNPTALDAEIAVAFDEKGKPTSTMTAREYLDKVKQEAASDIKDASLFEVAANCFLSGGA